MIKESCVENLAEAKKAEKQGAEQIELCGRLDLDGITPDDGLVKHTLTSLAIHVKVMVRPRGGNFVYSENEIEEMLSTISKFKAMGIKEVVLGALTKDNHLDTPTTSRLAAAARPMKVTFHKAIDELKDPVAGVRQLLEIPGITGILTSGGQPTAENGATVIREMIRAAKDKIQIIAAGKITNENLPEMHELIGAEAYHGKLIVGRLK